MFKSDKATTVRVLEFHKFASQKIVPCDETPTALCCHDNKVFAGFSPCKIVVYELSELGNTGYIKSAVLNTVGLPTVIKFCPIGETIISFEKDNLLPTNPQESTYDSGASKVYVYPFGLWSPEQMDASLKIVRVGRTTAQNYRGDILRKPTYEVIEISLDNGLAYKSEDKGVDKDCAMDVCPITGNLAIACGARISVYRLVFAGVAGNLLDYELMMQITTGFASIATVEILNSYFIAATTTKVQVFSIEVNHTPLITKKKSYASLTQYSSEDLPETVNFPQSKFSLPFLRSSSTDNLPFSPSYETSEVSIASSEYQKFLQIPKKTFKKNCRLSMLDLEKAIMGHLMIANPSVKNPCSDLESSLSFNFQDMEVVIPREAKSASFFSQNNSELVQGMLGASFLPLGRFVQVQWSRQFETDQIKFKKTQLPNLSVKYLFYRLMKPRLVSIQFSPRYSKVTVREPSGIKGCNESVFSPFCYTKPSQIVTQLSVVIASPHMGQCVDLTDEVNSVIEFPFSGECVSMCADECFLYVVFKDYLEVYTSKNLNIQCAVKDDNSDTSKLTSVPKFLAELWTNQAIFMCGRQNFYSLTRLERCKRSNDPILLQSVFYPSRTAAEKSVSTVYCLMKESVLECCQAMLHRAENLKWVAQSLYLSVVLEVWVLLLNNYNTQHASMFKSVSSKLLDSLALTPALSEISVQKLVRRTAHTTLYKVESFPGVPNNVLQFLIENSNMSNSDFLNNLCMCAETNQGLSIDVSALNFITESPDWVALLCQRVDESPKILSDLLKLSLSYAPHLVSKLLYGSNFQFSRYLSSSVVASYYNLDVLCIKGYLLSPFDKLAKASSHAACSQFDQFSQTLSSVKLDDFVRVLLQNVCLFFLPKESKQFSCSGDKFDPISVTSFRQTKFAQLLSKLHPVFYLTGLTELCKSGILSKEDAIKFCSSNFYDDIEKILSDFETLSNSNLRFLLERIIDSSSFLPEMRNDPKSDLYVAALIKVYILQDAQTVTKMRKSDQRSNRGQRSSLVTPDTEFLDNCASNMLLDVNFEWIKILSPFCSVAVQMACCDQPNDSESATTKKKRLSGVLKTTCETLPCPCLTCRKYILAAQSLLSNPEFSFSPECLSGLKIWLHANYQTMSRENPISVTGYYESTEKLIELRVSVESAVMGSLGKNDSRFVCLLLSANVGNLEINEAKDFYGKVSKLHSDNLEVELIILRYLAAHIDLEDLVRLIPPERKLEKYVEVLKFCNRCRKEEERRKSYVCIGTRSPVFPHRRIGTTIFKVSTPNLATLASDTEEVDASNKPIEVID